MSDVWPSGVSGSLFHYGSRILMGAKRHLEKEKEDNTPIELSTRGLASRGVT